MTQRVMSSKIIQIEKIESEEMELEVKFVFKSSYVSSISKDKILIQSFNEVEDYDGVHEANRYNRSEFIAILGIITFFSYYPLTVYNFIEGRDIAIEEDFSKPELDEYIFLVDGIDYSSDLKKLLLFSNDELETILTILDRWRKAIYMEVESNNATANLYHDEAILIHFGIIEFLAEKFSKTFNETLEEDIKDFLQSFYEKNFYLSDSQILEKKNIKYKFLKQILINEENNIKNKILFMLDDMGIYSDNINYLVNELIKNRNQIAHGRVTYQDKFIWPLPPFYYLTSDSQVVLDIIREFSKLVISKYIGLEQIHEEEFFRCLLPSKEIIKSFLANPSKYNLDSNKLINGNEFNVTLETLFYHYVHKTNINLDELISAIKNQFLDIVCNEDNGPVLLNISILFADDKNEKISQKARKNIYVIVKNDWHFWSNIKDALRYLEFYSVNIEWFKSWINNRLYIM